MDTKERTPCVFFSAHAQKVIFLRRSTSNTTTNLQNIKVSRIWHVFVVVLVKYLIKDWYIIIKSSSRTITNSSDVFVLEIRVQNGYA